MISSLWISKTGLDAQQINMNVISNNLANISTNGFKRSRAVFEDLMYQTIRQSGTNSSENTLLPSGLQLGAGVRPISAEKIYIQGNMIKTESATDIAINGEGFFKIELADGNIAYTRDGSFKLNENGQLVTNSGFPVIPAIVIPPHASSINIGRDGIVSANIKGQTQPTAISQISLTNFINNAGLESLGENLYQETQSSGMPMDSNPGTNSTGLLYQGYLETSNVNVAEELVNMIQTQRAYEINSKCISTSDQMLQKLSQL
ncbi:flagellar basal-body rod protein FlgG [Buchnera aphidicola]|uniref:flagellar basal-body rod protein FlgG n=1 Tax=Buchnera aphidicola TaxID=9 RepID=UPI003464CDAF